MKIRNTKYMLYTHVIFIFVYTVIIVIALSVRAAIAQSV